MLIFTAGLAAAVMIGIIDYVTGYSLALSFLYLLPVMFVTWKAGKYRGYVLAFASAVIWFWADFKARNADPASLILFWNGMTRLFTFALVVFLLARKETLYAGEKNLARTDPLTGARNRRAFEELLEKEISRQKRFGRSFSIAYIDCDNFKAVNDRSGHKTGDILLTRIADTVRKNMRDMDVFARLGGDEFAILMPEVSSEEAGEAVTRIMGLVRSEMEKNRWPVTLSIGIATFTHPVNSAADALQKADALMYAVKNKGKNSIAEQVF